MMLGWIPTWVRHRLERRDARDRADLRERDAIMARLRLEHAELQAQASLSSSADLIKQFQMNGWTELLLDAWKGREA